MHFCLSCKSSEKDRRTDRNRNQRCGNYNSVLEHEYDVVDDQEEVLSVRILPARPINDEREYADRDLPRSSSAQSPSSLSTGNSRILPRVIPINTGPAINRDLKPGRKKTRLDKRFTPVQPGHQPSHRPSPSPPPTSLDLEKDLPALTLRDPCKRDGQSATKRAEFSQLKKALHTNQRHSLDLETHDIEKRSQQNLGCHQNAITMSGLKQKKTLTNMTLFQWKSLNRHTAKKTGMLGLVVEQMRSTPYTW
ncbi:uncharacterized protein LOC127374775 isoform X3 [Dicentrarchus labrax]|uniref:uncharacterized protein LOC127374775 isoform X3 n=1 Tax=Dicentrarchus labrax TaxID=13489 RepID=UPI0021F5B4A1|nr:uncharacterized protein LOC127374775 isoform X3 [Dicentrarchus labrax]